MYEIKNERIAKFVQEGFQCIEGWCMDEVPYTIDILSNASINQIGGIAEVGVHHGKFYILLNQLTSELDTSYAIDIFDDQSLNIDFSGMGDLKKFKSNLVKYDLHQGSNTHIIKGDSTDSNLSITPFGKLKFISVDGGHSVEHTLNDLKIANNLITNQGVVILDDIFNHHWPGVTEGLIKFLLYNPTLIPFAIGFNKLYMCKVSFHEYYLTLFNSSSLAKKEVLLAGYRIVAM